MKKTSILFLLATMTAGMLHAQFDGAVGTPGCKAVKADDSRIKAWATGAQITRGYKKISNPALGVVSYGSFKEALGACDDDNLKVVSLGDAGVALLTFDRPIINGMGPDFAVFENSFDDYFLELAFVEVSTDGINFARFPATSKTAAAVGGFGQVDPTKINNLAGKYKKGWGTPFDLDELSHLSNIDINNIRFVRIIDVVGIDSNVFESRDKDGNIIFDPYPTDFPSGGFDLDGVAVLNGGNPYIISDFTSLLAADDLFDRKFDTTPGIHITTFDNPPFALRNVFNAEYRSWDGFALSRDTNLVDKSAFTNGYTANPATGMKDSVYAIGYFAGFVDPKGNCHINISPDSDGSPYLIEGAYVTNTFINVVSYIEGDSYAKKFGGSTGDDPDWCKITAYGFSNDTVNEGIIDSVEFYLADYRFADNSKDYIVEDWRWMDLSKLRNASMIKFTLSSSDVGAYGMNTPAYFALTDITLRQASNPTSIGTVANANINAVCYPNPTADVFYVETAEAIRSVKVYNIMGQEVGRAAIQGNRAEYDFNAAAAGVYFVRITTATGTTTQKIVKQ